MLCFGSLFILTIEATVGDSGKKKFFLSACSILGQKFFRCITRREDSLRVLRHATSVCMAETACVNTPYILVWITDVQWTPVYIYMCGKQAGTYNMLVVCYKEICSWLRCVSMCVHVCGGGSVINGWLLCMMYSSAFISLPITELCHRLITEQNYN